MGKPRSKIGEIRQAVADYIWSEGCSCCEDREAHERHSERLGKLLRVPKYEDGSGRDFSRFRSESKGGNDHA